MANKENILLFLDFDGVICDSVAEAFVSSRHAYLRHVGREAGKTDPAEKSLFVEYRPFIRGGADFVLLQECIAKNIVLESQHDFDRLAEEKGESTMDLYYRLFYQSRSEIITKDKDRWIELNALYPGIDAALRKLGSEAYIISTKQSAFVNEILRAKALVWSDNRIIHSGKTRKANYIQDLIDITRADRAIFVDDQIDHLQGLESTEVDPYLASWGYVKAEWLQQREIPVLDLEGFLSLLGRFA